MTEIKLGIVDDHQLFRYGIIGFLENEGKFKIILEASDGIDLTEKLEANNLPDIILMDINMPRMNGLDAVGWLNKNYPSVKVLVLSMSDDSENVLGMLRLGVEGYLLKDSKPSELIEAIRKIHEGEVYYPNFVTKMLIRYVNNSDDSIVLNDREKEFLKLSGTELTYKEIADAMAISVRTAEAYRESLFEKLNVKSRVGLVIYGIKNGLIGQ